MCPTPLPTDSGNVLWEIDILKNLLEFLCYDISVLYCTEGTEFIAAPNSVVYLHEGDPASFTCKVTGKPVPTIEWYKVINLLSHISLCFL